MMSFFLAVPDAGASYLFGMYPDDPQPALDPFRERNPGASMRLLTVASPESVAVNRSIREFLRTRVERTDMDVRWKTDGWGNEVSGETPEGVVAVEGLVRALAMGRAVSAELAPLGPPAHVAAKFFFAHAGETANKHVMGTTCDSPLIYIRGLRERHPSQTMTLYSGESARARELSIAVQAVLDDEDAANDPALVRDFLLPVFRAVLGPGEGGLNVRTFPGGSAC